MAEAVRTLAALCFILVSAFQLFVTAANGAVTASVVADKAPNGRVYRMYRLNNRSADHQSPDAIVFVPESFDRQAEFNVILFNHGLMDDLDRAVSFWELDQGFTHAPNNSVLILTEWATNPYAYSISGGRYYSPGFFRKMLDEILAKTPELAGKTSQDIRNIAITTYSGGWRASMAQIYDNGLGDKVTTLALLDSLYNPEGFDRWLRANAADLAAGRKQYFNFFFDTSANSMGQYRRLQSMLSKAGLHNTDVVKDLDSPQTVMSASQFANKGIVYKYNKLWTDTHHAHANVARLYFPEVMRALNLRNELAAKEVGRRVSRQIAETTQPGAM